MDLCRLNSIEYATPPRTKPEPIGDSHDHYRDQMHKQLVQTQIPRLEQQLQQGYYQFGMHLDMDMTMIVQVRLNMCTLEVGLQQQTHLAESLLEEMTRFFHQSTVCNMQRTSHTYPSHHRKSQRISHSLPRLPTNSRRKHIELKHPEQDHLQRHSN